MTCDLSVDLHLGILYFQFTVLFVLVGVADCGAAGSRRSLANSAADDTHRRSQSGVSSVVHHTK